MTTSSAAPVALPDLTPAEHEEDRACIATMAQKEARLAALDPVILDLSIREPAVGIPRGHTLDDKLALLQLAREAGFRDILLATFDVSLPEVPQVDDIFVERLRARGEDLTGTFAFVTIGTLEGAQFVPDLSMQKLVRYGIPNTIVDVYLSTGSLAIADRPAFVTRLQHSIEWMRTHMKGDGGGPPRIYINYVDAPDAFFEDWEWMARVTKLLGGLPVAAVTFEDGRGTSFPFQVGAMTALLRRHIGPGQHLLAHMHTGAGMENANLIEALLNGADGIWAGFAREAATIGHAPTSELLANLLRIGNTAVARRFRLERLVPIVQAMTRINTLAPVPEDFPIIGANAYRNMLSFFEQRPGRKMDLPGTAIGAAPGWRITPVTSDAPVITGRLVEIGVAPAEITPALITRMRTLMRDDMRAGERIEYDQPENLRALFERART